MIFRASAAGLNEICAVLGFYAKQNSKFLPSPILKREAIENGTDRLSRNVGGNLPFNDA